MSEPETSSEKYEYRVVWQREGLGPAIALRQTEKGALAKRDHLLWTETKESRRADDEGPNDYYSAMPRLIRLEIYYRKVEPTWTPLFVVPLGDSREMTNDG